MAQDKELTAEQKLAQLEKEIAEKDAIINDQASMIEDAAAAKGIVNPTFKADGHVYEVLAEAVIETEPGVAKSFTKAELAENKEMQAILIATPGCGIIRKVVKK
jgi:hypothetical protein